MQQKGYNDVITSNSNSTANKFGYNNKELDESLAVNWLEYGARNYSPDIGRFMNIDRMAEMYETLNPYNYTGNNPINFIDVNGEYIYIYDGDNKYRYENGQTQHKVDGEWTAIDENVSLSDDAIKTIAGLQALGNSENTGKDLINSFSNDDNNVDIKFSEGSPALYSRGTITLDPSTTESLWVQGENGPVQEDAPLFVALGHELGHAQDPVKYHDAWYAGNVGQGEIRATHIENKIRAESGLPLRTHYGSIYDRSTNTERPNPLGTIIDNNGNSVYYNRSNTRVGYPRRNGRPTSPNSGGIRDGINAHGGEILKARYNYNEQNGG